MTENNGNILIRRIGSTTYKVRAFFITDDPARRVGITARMWYDERATNEPSV